VDIRLPQDTLRQVIRRLDTRQPDILHPVATRPSNLDMDIHLEDIPRLLPAIHLRSRDTRLHRVVIRRHSPGIRKVVILHRWLRHRPMLRRHMQPHRPIIHHRMRHQKVTDRQKLEVDLHRQRLNVNSTSVSFS